MGDRVLVDEDVLRKEVQDKYREVALEPGGDYHFHLGRPAAERCGYDHAVLDALPDIAVESFAGVANPFALRALDAGERVVDVGCGAGFDTHVAAIGVGPGGSAVGVDMTVEMLDRARRVAAGVGFPNVEFREGLAEDLPIGDGDADVVISNGVINLVADKRRAFSEIFRILRPGGVLQFADIANGQPVPEEAVRDIDLWTA